ncbi:MAG: ATP-binding protein [Thermodesulfobacteriota bacterium]
MGMRQIVAPCRFSSHYIIMGENPEITLPKMTEDQDTKKIRRAGAVQPPDSLEWLIYLRWSAMACQVLLVLPLLIFRQTRVSLFANLEAPVFLIAVIFIFEAVSNFILCRLHKNNFHVPEQVVGLVFFFDIILLTGLLYVTGGAMTSFVFLYFIHIVFGAMVLSSAWSYSLSAWTVLWYFMLFVPAFRSIGALTDSLAGTSDESKVSLVIEYIFLQLQGLWGAFAITVFFIVYFVGKIRRAADNYYIAEQTLCMERARSEKLSSLTTLAAGAAHELSTPLSTISVAAGELSHIIKPANRDQHEDIDLIREQVVLCKEILYDMAAGAGENKGEELRKFLIGEAMDEIVHSFSVLDQQRIRMKVAVEQEEVTLPFRTFCRIVSSLIKNGLEATSEPSPVDVRWFEEDGKLCLSISDTGEGMSDELIRQSTEPFFTTKKSGMGLGLFLAKTMAVRFGGDLLIKSGPGSTTVKFCLATEQVSRPEN